MPAQTIIALAIVGLAVAYLVFRAIRKGRPGCGSDCGCGKSDRKK